jgi:hypothetical protein
VSREQICNIIILEEAAVAVCTTPVEVLDILCDAGLLESRVQGRYTLHQTIADYGRAHLTDTAAFQRMVACFVDFIKTHEKDYAVLEQEMA